MAARAGRPRGGPLDLLRLVWGAGQPRANRPHGLVRNGDLCAGGGSCRELTGRLGLDRAPNRDPPKGRPISYLLSLISHLQEGRGGRRLLHVLLRHVREVLRQLGRADLFSRSIGSGAVSHRAPLHDPAQRSRVRGRRRNHIRAVCQTHSCTAGNVPTRPGPPRTRSCSRRCRASAPARS